VLVVDESSELLRSEDVAMAREGRWLALVPAYSGCSDTHA
jgi:hypothetical protein